MRRRLKSAEPIRKMIEPYLPSGELVIVEKNLERRITTGVMYQPGVPDAHGEYAEAEDLEDAVHSYMTGGDLKIRKQHDINTVIGDVVGMISWPFEHKVTLRSGSGLRKAKEVTLPAGTVYTTVKWTPEAWPLIKNDKIRGYSMGGRAVRLRAP